MELVLREDVENVGLRGEVVNVARGYARNYLLPRGLAEVATPALQKEVAKRDAMRARNEAKTVDEARAIAERLESKEIRFDVSAGPTGSLFGSVTATNVGDPLWGDHQIRLDRPTIPSPTARAPAARRTSFRDRSGLPPALRPRRGHRFAAAARTRPAGACASSPARPSRS